MSKTLKTVSQLALELNVSTTTIYNKIRTGEFKTIKVGKITLIEC